MSGMRNHHGRLSDLVKERDRLVKKLSGYKHILRGTIVKQGNICGTPGCICKRKYNHVPHGPYNYLSHRSRKSINMIFLNKKKLPLAEEGVREYDGIIELIYRIAEINFRLLRYHYDKL